MGKTVSMCTVLVLVLGFAAVASATDDDFFATIFPDGSVEGGGTGWENGLWIEYPNAPEAPPAWWNQWFYDDPPDQSRWKEIFYHIEMAPDPTGMPGEGGIVEVALNWSTLDYPMTGPGGQPPMAIEEHWIERASLGMFDVVDPTLPVVISNLEQGPFVIPYNPEWVSIDVRLVDPLGAGVPIILTGQISHVCVPEPSTFVLAGMGLLGLAYFGWRKRR